MDITVDIGFSKIIFFSLLLLHLVTLVVVYLLTISFVLKAGLFLFIIVGFCYSFLCINSVSSLTKKVEEDWELTLPSFQRRRESSFAKLVGEVYLTRWLIIMRFKVTGRKFKKSIILSGDSASKKQLRQLRQFLLFGGSAR